MANDIAEKIRKLLKLSQSTNVHEAATAATRAQELMLQYKMEAADLEIQCGEERSYEPVKEETLEGTKSYNSRAQRWRITLAGRLARAFGCKIYYSPGTTHIGIIGRPSDVQTVRYLQQYFGLEITRLCEQSWRLVKEDCAEGYELPRPTVWKNSFRDGAVNEIAKRMDEQHGVNKKRTRVDNATKAIVLVRQDEEKRDVDVEEMWKEKFGPRGGRSANWSASQHSRDGYSAGQRAGGRIPMNSARGGISGSKSRIGD